MSEEDQQDDEEELIDVLNKEVEDVDDDVIDHDIDDDVDMANHLNDFNLNDLIIELDKE